ncbi:MAG: energy-coupling factor transporter transmembrane protein EcfT [Merismopedia sp. SIO2A8]|nr:energy-coupling factor transporter transmembrane protein EcfT [Merismopedia sp. SIO2A8]
MDLLRSLPIGLYIEEPITWLHRVDSRIKFVWLLGFLLTPIAARPEWRIALVGLLLLLTISARIPIRIWKRQIGLLLAFSVLLFLVTLVLPDGINANHHPRLPPTEWVVSSSADPSSSDRTTSSPQAPLPQPTAYRYVIFDKGIFRITRRSVDLAIRVSTLTFTLLYSSNLYLLTTAPEEITAGVDYWLSPFRRVGLPVTEIVLTLTLSLRFIPLVLEEVQNLIRAVSTRAINWKKLGVRGTVQIWLTIAERLLQNLLLRADQIASAMQVRGFTSPDTHRVQWHQFKLRSTDWIVGLGLFFLVAARFTWG